MSDRASNKKLANKLLNDWRGEILQNFDEAIQRQSVVPVVLGFHNFLVPDILEKKLKFVETDGPLGRDKMPVFNIWSKKQSAVDHIRYFRPTWRPPH